MTSDKQDRGVELADVREPSMRGSVTCRHCRCHGDCKLESGEECIVNSRTGVCSNPRCQMAEIERRRRPRAKREDPFRVIERDATGKAVRIVPNRKYRRGR